MKRSLGWNLLIVATVGLATALATGPLWAGPKVSVVVDANAPSLEKFAAREVAELFRQLFEAEVNVESSPSADAAGLVLVGSPATNGLVKELAGSTWPKLTDQGHVVRSVELRGRPAVIVGGGSPVATLWGAYELGQQLGVRYLLGGDALPAERPPFRLTGFNVTLEPALRLRSWRTVNDFPIGPESWGLADQRQLLRQLAKLKFNRILISVYAWQPFVHFEFQGVKKQSALLWYGYRYPVSGDTAGRAAFRGLEVFDNPDFVGKTTYADRLAAGTNLVRGIIDTAHDLGMTAAIALSPLEFPREFAAALPESKVIHQLENLTIGPGSRQPPDDPLLKALAATQLQAYLKTYPTIDALYLTMPEFPDWVEHHDRAWQRLRQRTGLGEGVDMEQLTEVARTRNLIASGERGVKALRGNIAALDFFHSLLSEPRLLRRPDGKSVEVTLVDIDPALYHFLDKVLPEHTSALHFVDYTARRVASHPDILTEVPAKAVRSNLILTLADDNVGVLPQMSTTHLHALLGQLRKQGWEGYSTRYWIAGDLTPAVHYLSRASFDAQVTPRLAYQDLINAVSGEGVADRVIQGFEMIERATDLIDQHDIGFTFPVPNVVMKHYAATEPSPAWWSEVKTLYAKAMDEMYRGNTRARQGARPFTLYYAKRLEFAVHYMTSIDAVRSAGVAKSKGNKDEQIAQLEKATEAMYNALNAYGEVARDQSDRGVIAVLNEYGYRRLVAELDAVSQ